MISLIVPGSSDRMLTKARSVAVDELIIDLEDAVVPERKAEALEGALGALHAGGFAAARVSVRINALDTPWAEPELAALSSANRPPDAIIVPKASQEAISTAARLSTPHTGRLHALIETATGLAQVDEIAAVSDRLEALIIGYADLAVSLGRSGAGAANLDLWLAVQDRVLTAARAHGLRAIDGPFLGLDDVPGLTRSARRSAELGFDGKWAIHPAQVEAIRAAFTPTGPELDHARAVLEALASAERDGAGAVRLNGQMLDEPVRHAAQRTLARAGEAEQ